MLGRLTFGDEFWGEFLTSMGLTARDFLASMGFVEGKTGTPPAPPPITLFEEEEGGGRPPPPPPPKAATTAAGEAVAPAAEAAAGESCMV